MSADAFGHAIDPTVGYARGAFLDSSAAEVRRLRHAQRIAAEVVAARGVDSIGIFTGNARTFPLTAEDLDLAEEWVGPGRFAERLHAVAVDHLGGRSGDAVAVVNRTSAGIVAAMVALSGGRPVVSIVPTRDRSHASVIRGCALARVRLLEIDQPGEIAVSMRNVRPALAVVTTVTSTLARLEDGVTRAAVRSAHEVGAKVLMDEAYGARLRPVLHGGAKSLELGADAAITNTDKGGLSGPRGGVIAGSEAVVLPVLAKASELGIEARAPIALGALRSLEAFDPRILQQEVEDGRAVANALVERLGAETVVRSDLGPSLGEDVVARLVHARADGSALTLVPCEITAAVGMVLLREHGVLTVNSHGQPGGRVSIRLKPTAGAVARVGGPAELAGALDAALSTVADRGGDPAWVAATLFGPEGS